MPISEPERDQNSSCSYVIGYSSKSSRIEPTGPARASSTVVSGVVRVVGSISTVAN